MNITKNIFLMNSLRINIKTSHNRIIGVLTAPCVQCLHNQTGKNNNRTSRVSQNFVHLSQKNFSNSCRFEVERWSNNDNKILLNNKTLYNQSTRSLISNIKQQNIHWSRKSKVLRRKDVCLVHQRDLSLSPKSILDASPTSLQPYLRLIRFDKPIGTWLLYWPCTWSIGLAAAPGHLPDIWLLTLFGAGAFFMRGAGCIVNDMWDRDIDKKVERTRLRPLTSGELSSFQGLCCLGGMLSVSLLILLQFNWYSVFLGAASMFLVIAYPLAKRVTYWPQAMLGLTLNWGVLLAWSAIQGSIQGPVVSLYVSCVLYTMIYDSIYSHQDKYDDMLIGVKSTALKFGDKTKHWLSGFGTIMIGGLTYTGIACDQTWPYFTGVAITAAHIAHQLYTVDLDNADDCATKFRSNTGLGLIMFLGVVLGTLMKTPNKETKKIEEVVN